MIKVITFGVFDYFHLGHLRLFENARHYGDYLIVAVQEEASIFKTKPNAKVLYTTEQRIELVSSLRVVDEVIVYNDVDKTISQVDFDIFVVGEDQVHAGFQRAIGWCEDNGKQVIRLRRTPGISSTQLKKTHEKLG